MHRTCVCVCVRECGWFYVRRRQDRRDNHRRRHHCLISITIGIDGQTDWLVCVCTNAVITTTTHTHTQMGKRQSRSLAIHTETALNKVHKWTFDARVLIAASLWLRHSPFHADDIWPATTNRWYQKRILYWNDKIIRIWRWHGGYVACALCIRRETTDTVSSARAATTSELTQPKIPSGNTGDESARADIKCEWNATEWMYRTIRRAFCQRV